MDTTATPDRAGASCRRETACPKMEIGLKVPYHCPARSGSAAFDCLEPIQSENLRSDGDNHCSPAS
jgi:hypothetical protein